MTENFRLWHWNTEWRTSKNILATSNILSIPARHCQISIIGVTRSCTQMWKFNSPLVSLLFNIPEEDQACISLLHGPQQYPAPQVIPQSTPLTQPPTPSVLSKVPMTIPMDSTSLPLWPQICGLLETLVCTSQGLLHSSAIKCPCVPNSCVNFIRAILAVPSLHWSTSWSS